MQQRFVPTVDIWSAQSRVISDYWNRRFSWIQMVDVSIRIQMFACVKCIRVFTGYGEVCCSSLLVLHSTHSGERSLKSKLFPLAISLRSPLPPSHLWLCLEAGQMSVTLISGSTSVFRLDSRRIKPPNTHPILIQEWFPSPLEVKSNAITQSPTSATPM